MVPSRTVTMLLISCPKALASRPTVASREASFSSPERSAMDSRSPWRSLAAARPSAAAASMAPTSTSGGQGFMRKRKTCPSLTAAMAPSRDAWPVRRTRTASGAVSRERRRNSAPSMPGIR